MSTLWISACLLGRACRYDGRSVPRDAVQDAAAAWRGPVRAVCPEELGGLGTPRPPAELRGGDGAEVLAGRARVERVQDGADVTDAFRLGAERAADGAAQGDLALLKARSPSCGCRSTHVDGAVVPGRGVFAALLARRGVRLLDEEDPAVSSLSARDSRGPGQPPEGA